ncbi:hypothetical protein SAY87_023924 [Trapa incisa]|uniref:Uncharacterized protein n=1 Tax=Trapa incisa TaxID=236973 RepID=A0AAN7KTD2_9MYRT|nr:hypothetical protein SAY87_023924 [Trapa incisa]
MLQLFFALAFSAVPLTLYLPPIRSLNLFVETTEEFLRHIALYALSAYPRIRLACSRIFNSVTRFARILSFLLQFVVIHVKTGFSDPCYKLRGLQNPSPTWTDTGGLMTAGIDTMFINLHHFIPFALHCCGYIGPRRADGVYGFSCTELDFCPTLIKPILSPRPVNEEDLRPPCTLHGWTCMCMGFLFLLLHSRIRLPCEEISRERELVKMDNAGRWPVFSPPLLPGSAHFA